MSVIIIGAGINGLTTAFYLAKAGLKPLVLERRSMVGGGAITEEIAPGFQCPTLAHAIGPLRPSVVRDMRLAARGVEFIAPDPRLVSLAPEGRVLAFSRDIAPTVEASGRSRMPTPGHIRNSARSSSDWAGFLVRSWKRRRHPRRSRHRRDVGSAKDWPAVSRARPLGFVQAASMDADARRGSRRGVVSADLLQAWSPPAAFSAWLRDPGPPAPAQRYC